MTARGASRFLAVSLLGLTLPHAALPAAGWADGDGKQRAPHVSAAPPPLVESHDVACLDAGTAAGTVTSVSGAAFARAPGEDPRSLACDDVVRACDRVFTSDGAHLAMLVNDVFVQLGSASGLTLQSTAATFQLDSGAVRVIDTRSAGDAAHFQLSTPQLASRGLRSDTEVRVGIVGGNARTELCSFGDPVTVSTSAGAQTVGAGSCIEVVGSTLGQLADGSPTLGLEAAMECRREHFDLADRFLPTDVGAPPLDPYPFLPPAGPFGRKSCDDPGSGCAGPPAPLLSVEPVFRDPNPQGGCGFPGASCGGGGS